MKYYRFFSLLNRKPLRWIVRGPVYYWLLDLLTDNNGWRPLFYQEKRRNGQGA